MTEEYNDEVVNIFKGLKTISVSEARKHIKEDFTAEDLKKHRENEANLKDVRWMFQAYQRYEKMISARIEAEESNTEEAKKSAIKAQKDYDAFVDTNLKGKTVSVKGEERDYLDVWSTYRTAHLNLNFYEGLKEKIRPSTHRRWIGATLLAGVVGIGALLGLSSSQKQDSKPVAAKMPIAVQKAEPVKKTTPTTVKQEKKSVKEAIKTAVAEKPAPAPAPVAAPQAEKPAPVKPVPASVAEKPAPAPVQSAPTPKATLSESTKQGLTYGMEYFECYQQVVSARFNKDKASENAAVAEMRSLKKVIVDKDPVVWASVNNVGRLLVKAGKENPNAQFDMQQISKILLQDYQARVAAAQMQLRSGMTK